MSARLSALLVWALVAASAVAWGLHLFATGPRAPANTVVASEGAVAGGDLTRLLGTPPVAVAAPEPVPALASRFRLTGVVAARPPATQGIALIAVDGKTPRAFVVGATIDGDLSLKSVDRRTASIGNPGGGSPVVLEMPPLPVAATGVLSPARGDAPVNTFPQLRPPQPQTFPSQQPQVQMGVPPGLQQSPEGEQQEPPHGAQPPNLRQQPTIVQ